MSELADLGARITRLEDVEAIKKLKAKYWRCVDRRQPDEIVDLFTDDAVAEFSHRGRFEGRDAIMAFVRQVAQETTTIRTHHGHNPEIEITGDYTAKGTWQIFHYMIDDQANKGRRQSGFYYDEYAKVNGEWKIKSAQLRHVFREEIDRERQGLRLI